MHPVFLVPKLNQRNGDLVHQDKMRGAPALARRPEMLKGRLSISAIDAKGYLVQLDNT